jgi:hypothetical protein
MAPHLVAGEVVLRGEAVLALPADLDVPGHEDHVVGGVHVARGVVEAVVKRLIPDRVAIGRDRTDREVVAGVL